MTALLSLLAADKQQGNPLFSLLVFALPVGAIVYMMIIPQRKQRAKQAEFLSKLAIGDEVVTSGGIYGTINDIEDGVAHLQVDVDAVIRVAVTSLSRTAGPEATAADAEDDDGDEGSDSGGAADKKRTK